MLESPQFLRAVSLSDGGRAGLRGGLSADYPDGFEAWPHFHPGSSRTVSDGTSARLRNLLDGVAQGRRFGWPALVAGASFAHAQNSVFFRPPPAHAARWRPNRRGFLKESSSAGHPVTPDGSAPCPSKIKYTPFYKLCQVFGGRTSTSEVRPPKSKKLTYLEPFASIQIRFFDPSFSFLPPKI